MLDQAHRILAADRAGAGSPGESRMIWVNGEQQRLDGPHVSAFDRGLTLADGVFETMHVREGTAFRLDRHLARVAQALTALAIPAVPDLPAWVVNALRSATGEMSLRLTVTRGVAAGGVAPPSHASPTVIIALNPMPHFPDSTYNPGLNVHIASGRRNEHAATAGLKTLAYPDAVLALIEANRAGADDALFLDTEGHCSEASSSNLFMWSGGELVTPPLSCGALPGITRATILELAETLGVSCVERPFGLEQLLRAEEAFLTSSLRQIAPIARIGNVLLGNGAPGRFTRQISLAYRTRLTSECSR